MIIRKDIKPNKIAPSDDTAQNAKSSVIKKGDLLLSNNTVEKSSREMSCAKEEQKSKLPSDELAPVEKKEEEIDDFEKIDISSIEFKERIERRRGDRRRGYRRIDERSLVSRAQQEAHGIKELAAREGYKSGFEKSQQEIEQIKNDLTEFLNMRDEMHEKFYPHILEIALAATEKIIKKEVELSQDVLKNVILSAMDEINSDAQRVEIKVNSCDVEFTKASLPEIIQTKNQGIKINVSPDDTIEKGSCVLIANNGVIDANFKTQLAVLQNSFGIYKGGM